MATNYTFAQAIKIMHEGNNTEAIVEITRRFPQLALMVNTVLTKAGEDFVKLASAFPDYLTANKMNSMLKKGAAEDGDEESTEEATEEAAETEEKVRKPRRRKAEKEEVQDEDTDSDDPYAGKSAMDLFKECKKRKIKAEPKKPAKFYADLLKKDDAAKSKVEDTEDDGWDDDDEEVEEKKPAKKAAKKPAKKEEDDDEDWDI